MLFRSGYGISSWEIQEIKFLKFVVHLTFRNKMITTQKFYDEI